MKENKVLYLVFVLLVLITGFLLASYFWRNISKKKGDLPGYALRNSDIKTSYKYAVSDPGLLENIPCYCNCHRLGHKNVKDCFIEKKEENKIVFSDHGANCGICYSIVLDAKKMNKRGKSVQEIRSFIDNKYSRYGRGTNTPKP